MRVGQGSHTYEWVGDWAKLPPGVQFGFTHGVVVDAKDNVYIHNQSHDAVCVFDRDGNFLTSWGADFAQGAHGMALHKEHGTEYLYLSDYVRHIVVKTTLDGDVVWTLGRPPLDGVYESAEKYKPTDAAAAPDGGDVYVVDGYGESWIHRYTNDGRYIGSFGGPGSEPGKVKNPHGIFVDLRRSEPTLLVADRTNERIQIFSMEGQHIGFVTDELRRPCDFYAFGDEIVIPDLRARVTIFDKDNKLITHLGDNPSIWERQGWPNLPHAERLPGKFNSPHGCCVDSRGDIYVVEWINDGRVTKLVRV